MTNAYRDENGVPTLIAAKNTDGATIMRLRADSSTHALSVDDGTAGTDKGPTNDLRDENGATCLMAVSSSDGQTPVILYTDANNLLLLKST